MNHAVQKRDIVDEPRGALASRTLAMPANTNPRGDIFGGWIMALMDAAASMTAAPPPHGRHPGDLRGTAASSPLAHGSCRGGRDLPTGWQRHRSLGRPVPISSGARSRGSRRRPGPRRQGLDDGFPVRASGPSGRPSVDRGEWGGHGFRGPALLERAIWGGRGGWHRLGRRQRTPGPGLECLSEASARARGCASLSARARELSRGRSRGDPGSRSHGRDAARARSRTRGLHQESASPHHGGGGSGSAEGGTPRQTQPRGGRRGDRGCCRPTLRRDPGIFRTCHAASRSSRSRTSVHSKAAGRRGFPSNSRGRSRRP